jgi:hypothetical protein
MLMHLLTSGSLANDQRLTFLGNAYLGRDSVLSSIYPSRLIDRRSQRLPLSMAYAWREEASKLAMQEQFHPRRSR